MQVAQLHVWTVRRVLRCLDPAHSPCSSMVSLSFKLTFPDCTARRTVEAYSWEGWTDLHQDWVCFLQESPKASVQPTQL